MFSSIVTRHLGSISQVTLVRSRVPTSLSKLLFRRQITKRNVSFSNRAKPTKSVASTFTGDVVLFSIDRKRTLMFGTIASIMQMIFWGSMADLLWQMYSTSPTWKKVLLSAGSILIGSSVMFIRKSYGEHYINRLEWLAGQNKLRIGYYNFWSTPKTKEIDVSIIKPISRENTNWFLFKTTQSRLWYLLDKTGKVNNEKILKAVINGQTPTSL